MTQGGQIIAAAAARLHAPLLMLFALMLLADRAAGHGVGFVAGLAFALAPVLHALVFGASAARAAFPAPFARLTLAIGVIGAACGAGLPDLAWAPQFIEGGLFLAVVGAGALIVQVVFSRAASLRDSE